MKYISLFLLKESFQKSLKLDYLILFASVLGVTFYFNSQTANSSQLGD